MRPTETFPQQRKNTHLHVLGAENLVRIGLAKTRIGIANHEPYGRKFLGNDAGELGNV